jgi:hypothetical protein
MEPEGSLQYSQQPTTGPYTETCIQSLTSILILSSRLRLHISNGFKPKYCTRAVWKVRGLAAVRRCYAEGGGDCYAKL